MLRDESDPALENQQPGKVPLIDDRALQEALSAGTPEAMCAAIEAAVDNQIGNLVADLINDYNNIQKNQYDDISRINSDLMKGIPEPRPQKTKPAG